MEKQELEQTVFELLGFVKDICRLAGASSIVYGLANRDMKLHEIYDRADLLAREIHKP